MTEEEIDIQKEIEKYFTESTGFGKDKIRNFMDIVNKALKQKGERIEELENKIADIKANCDLAIEGGDIKIKELEQQIEKMKCCYNCANDTLEPPEVISNGVCENCIKHSKWELQY